MRVLLAPVTPLQQNCTIVVCARTSRAAVIDPGGEVDRLVRILKENDLTLDRIWVTHGHLDHAGGASDLQERTGVPIEGPHRDDEFWIDSIEAQGALYGLPEVRRFKPDRWLDDGDTVAVGDLTFDVLHCPGHTPGHVVFFNRAAGFAQVGDVLFQGNIGRTDFPRGDAKALIGSITGKLWPLGDSVRFVPGHGPMSTFGAERRSNPFVADHVLAARAP